MTLDPDTFPNFGLASCHLIDAGRLLSRAAGKHAIAPDRPGLIWEAEDAVNAIRSAVRALGYDLTKVAADAEVSA